MSKTKTDETEVTAIENLQAVAVELHKKNENLEIDLKSINERVERLEKVIFNIE